MSKLKFNFYVISGSVSRKIHFCKVAFESDSFKASDTQDAGYVEVHVEFLALYNDT